MLSPIGEGHVMVTSDESRPGCCPEHNLGALRSHVPSTEVEVPPRPAEQLQRREVLQSQFCGHCAPAGGVEELVSIKGQHPLCATHIGHPSECVHPLRLVEHWNLIAQKGDGIFLRVFLKQVPGPIGAHVILHPQVVHPFREGVADHELYDVDLVLDVADAGDHSGRRSSKRLIATPGSTPALRSSKRFIPAMPLEVQSICPHSPRLLLKKGAIRLITEASLPYAAPRCGWRAEDRSLGRGSQGGSPSQRGRS